MTPITIQTTIKSDMDSVWQAWTDPEQITQWAFASDDWEAPRAKNDLSVGGRFMTTMAAKDGSSQFDFGGVYTEVIPHEYITYTMDDGRKVSVHFIETLEGIEITQTFDPETENSPEMQKEGWQAILDNFKRYVEGIGR